MDSSTKESLYAVLNLIDYLESVSFISLDLDKVNQIRESIFSVINSGSDAQKNDLKHDYETDFTKLIVGFFTNAKKWEKKTVNDIIGNVVVFISSQDDVYINHIVNEMNEKIKNLDIPKKNKKSKSSNNNTFVNTWFNYFEKFREKNDK